MHARPAEITLSLKQGKGISLIDMPGVGESEQRDAEYAALYRRLLPELDLVLWVIKGDDRALCARSKIASSSSRGARSSRERSSTSEAASSRGSADSPPAMNGNGRPPSTRWISDGSI